MGSGSSRSRPRDDGGTRRGISAFLCGAGAGSAPSSSSTAAACVPSQVSGKEPSAVFPQNNLSVSMNEDSRPCESSNCCLKNGLIKPINAESSNSGKCLSESKELVPLPTNHSSDLDVTYSERNCNQASTSAKSDTLASPSTSGNGNAMLGPILEPESPNNYYSQTSPLGYPSSIVQESRDLPTSAASSTVDSTTEVLVIHSSDSNPISAVSDSSPTPHLMREPTMESSSSAGARFTSTGPGIERDENVIHVDVVSISSNIVTNSTAEVSDNEARRNSRRLFWDAFSRRSSRRNNDSLMIFSSAEDTDDLESHSRWLLDISDDIFENGTEDEFSYLRRRRLGASGRRWHSRSEIRERIRGNLDDGNRQSAFCSSGLHPYGTCSCYSYVTSEESSTRASISRIVMLAEALFEVLDEMHRQPESLSLSMVSLPAPESVVNSLPIKIHKKLMMDVGSDDVEQCYICLADYEDGDKIRLLPCHHEYHMACVDKWLKEIHGVCPLCRGDVCESAVDGSTS
ncbi:putative transcription factor C2H2 family [Dioscorea sansibarensis]